ncbi:hypothetical protein TELCIR_14547, partial [Teladorsagia circumcincta]
MNSTYTTTVPPPPLYEELSKGIMEKARSAAIAGPQVADAPPLYPSLTKTHYEKDEHGLLTEQNLLAFYHNPLYMMSEEFTDKFVQNNLIPSGPLFPLLKRLKKLCEQMAISEVSEKENTESLSKCLRDCWVLQQQTFESKGRCGENKEATGTGRFNKSVLCMEKVEELKNLLAANRTHLLDERICQESQFRATALQAPSPPKVKVDYCVTMLSHLMNPISQSVRELCSHWTITRNLLRAGEDSQLQKEVDRVVLLAVQYLATRPGLAKAVNGWLFCSHEVTRKGFDFSVFDLDYLLQLILADDKNIWLDFVDTSKLTQEEQQEERLFSLTCHLGPRDPSQHVSDHFLNKPRNSRAIGFPVLPAHRALPPPPVVDMSALFHVNTVMEMINPLIKHIRTISDDYVVGGENMASEDVKYVELVTKLHAPVMQQIPIQLRCGIRCANPYNTAVQVTTTKFNEATDAQMAQSREKRSTILGELHTGVLDRAAIASATMEHIARQLVRLSVLCSSSHRAGAQMTGRAMLKTVTSSLTGSEMLFPAASAAYEHTLRVLAE